MREAPPVVTLIGRPNVGKSTLFNRLTGTRDALVANSPGLTRDRQYGFGRVGEGAYVVVDTGGLVTERGSDMETLLREHSLQALAQCDAVLFLTDARAGLMPADSRIAERLRRAHKPIYMLVNKAEGLNGDIVSGEFHQLGLGEPIAVSAANGQGVAAMINTVLRDLGAQALPPDAGEQVGGVRIAVIGRPNVGKSTLVNRILGEDRVVAYDQPGTTRDSILIPFVRDGRPYTLVDTAGVRRRSRIDDVIEKFSVIKAMQALQAADVVIVLSDARQGIGVQDARLLGLAADSGRAIVIGVNKWDGLERDQRRQVRREIDLRLPFLDYAKLHFVSALHGTGVGDLLTSADQAYAAAVKDLPTPALTRVLEQAVAAHAPPAVRGRRIKLRYAHQGGRNPPSIVIHGNQTQALTPDYRRYLVNRFRQAFSLQGTPILLHFRGGDNPYQGRRNTLTPRQARHRKRLKKFTQR